MPVSRPIRHLASTAKPTPQTPFKTRIGKAAAWLAAVACGILLSRTLDLRGNIRAWSKPPTSALAIADTTPTVDQRQSVRNDAMLLMGGSVMVPGVAAYCHEYVRPNARLVAAAVAWNSRNRVAMEAVVRAIEWAGGLSPAEKAKFDRIAFGYLKGTFDNDSNKPGLCTTFEVLITAGELDLASKADTAPALARLVAAGF